MASQENKLKSSRSARPCPICNKMSIEKYHPFCSGRCANIDLHHWLNGSYAIPAQEGVVNPESDNETDEGGT